MNKKLINQMLGSRVEGAKNIYFSVSRVNYLVSTHIQGINSLFIEKKVNGKTLWIPTRQFGERYQQFSLGSYSIYRHQLALYIYRLEDFKRYIKEVGRKANSLTVNHLVMLPKGESIGVIGRNAELLELCTLSENVMMGKLLNMYNVYYVIASVRHYEGLKRYLENNVEPHSPLGRQAAICYLDMVEPGVNHDYLQY
ncbi:hypothetical protein SAMN04487934_1119 [Eubacterium ruminantium]|nr:hypothetical protein SAMN04487934_1119 [Eubacterium ruminantium]